MKQNALFAVLGGAIVLLVMFAFSLTSNDIERCIKRGHLPETCYSIYN